MHRGCCDKHGMFDTYESDPCPQCADREAKRRLSRKAMHKAHRNEQRHSHA